VGVVTTGVLGVLLGVLGVLLLGVLGVLLGVLGGIPAPFEPGAVG